MKIFGLRWGKKLGESKTKLLGIEIGEIIILIITYLHYAMQQGER